MENAAEDTRTNSEKIEAHIDSTSYYRIAGWAWCPQQPSARVQVLLLSSSGEPLASLPANEPRKDLADMSIGDGSYGYSFYGLLKGAAKIAFVHEESRIEQPLQIEPPPLPDYLSPYDFYLIHPNDYLFKSNMGRASIDECVKAYMAGGIGIADRLRDICAEYMRDKDKPLDLLDFASGFGRVSRCLDTSFFNVTASDIHEEAMSFIHEQLPGAKTLLSSTNPQNFRSDASFDVIFALSFFSHMPDSTFGTWLVSLYKILRPGGLLIFTAHGRTTNQNAKLPLKDGYGFFPTSEQKDLDSFEYGITISELPYVVRVMHDRIGQYPIFFQEGADIASGNQDLYIVRKEDASAVSSQNDEADIKIAAMGRALVEQRQAFQNSTSWKITKPLRALKALFSKEARGE